VIAVDTNVLVYAHRSDSTWHEPAAATVRQLAESPAPWAIAWSCLHEFFSIVTHPRIYDPSTSTQGALDQMEAWLESPSLVLLHETHGHFDTLQGLVHAGHITGARVHDARIAAICLTNGVRELWTADRDFSRFPDLRTRNPLVA